MEFDIPENAEYFIRVPNNKGWHANKSSFTTIINSIVEKVKSLHGIKLHDLRIINVLINHLSAIYRETIWDRVGFSCELEEDHLFLVFYPPIAVKDAFFYSKLFYSLVVE